VISLVEPCINRADEYFELCNEYTKIDNSRHKYIDTLEKAIKRIESDIKIAGEEIPSGKVRTLVRWAQNENGRIVGTCRIRLALNSNLEKTGGHIGYDVRPECRRNGFGTEILRLAIKEIRGNGIEDILITCDDDNIGSYKIIENNGGKLENKIWDSEIGKEVRRYWIKG
jgi:predicted acetyltransferase